MYSKRNVLQNSNWSKWTRHFFLSHKFIIIGKTPLFHSTLSIKDREKWWVWKFILFTWKFTTSSLKIVRFIFSLKSSSHHHHHLISLPIYFTIQTILVKKREEQLACLKKDEQFSARLNIWTSGRSEKVSYEICVLWEVVPGAYF